MATILYSEGRISEEMYFRCRTAAFRLLALPSASAETVGPYYGLTIQH